MQPSNLTLRIQWLGHDVKHVQTNTFDVIEDCLAREGFTAAEGSTIFAACRGQQLKTHLTFHANDVADGSLIILIVKVVMVVNLDRLQMKNVRNADCV